MPCNNTCLMGDICGDRYGGSQKPPCASKPVELSTTAPNTGSPKLPTLEVCIANLYRDTAAGTVGLTAVEVAKNVHGYISRQLRAGA